MQTERARPTAEIIPFARPAALFNRFTTTDRIELLQWEAEIGGAARLAIHMRLQDDPPEVGEFASIYPANAPWAAWGAVREGRGINVWRARDGRDIGRFATMGEALRAVTPFAR